MLLLSLPSYYNRGATLKVEYESLLFRKNMPFFTLSSTDVVPFLSSTAWKHPSSSAPIVY